MKEEAEVTNTDLARQEPGASSMLDVIARAVANPLVDVDKMSKLLDMQERIMTDQRKIAFMAANARLTPKLPQIQKNGRVSYETKSGGKMETKYALLEDIDKIIRPLIAEEGFSQSYDSEQLDNGKVRVTCKLSHAEGHSETKQITLAIDKTGAKNDAQAVISTISYARRILTKMFFNLIEAGEDTDGNNPATITADQVKDIETAIADLKMDLGKFLVFMGVGELKDILAKDWKKATNAIDTRRRNPK